MISELNRRKGYILPPLAFALVIVLIILLVIAFVPEVRNLVLDALKIITGQAESNSTTSLFLQLIF